jgi:tryptophan synthase beta chain
MAMRLARGMPRNAIVLANLSGRGDKDIHSIAEREGIHL